MSIFIKYNIDSLNLIHMSYQYTSSNRDALGQISEKFKSIQNIEKKDKPSKQNINKRQRDGILNQNELMRLKQLKNKYKNVDSIKSQNIFSEDKKTKQPDLPFNQIIIRKNEIQNTKRQHQTYQKLFKYDLKQCQKEVEAINKYPNESPNSNSISNLRSEMRIKINSYREKLDKNMQKVNNKIQTEIQKVQRKLSQLKKNKHSQISYSDKIFQSRQKQSLIKIQKENPSSSKQTNKIFQKSKQYSFKNNNLKNYEKSVERQDHQNLQKKREEYATQLRNVNFIEEMKRKIQAIEAQKKLSISKKLSQIKDSSKCSGNYEKENLKQEQFDKKILQTQSSDFKHQKITLANLTPNLAQSQVIEISDRERYPTDRSKNSQTTNQYKPLYKSIQNFNNYKVNYIIEQKQNEDHSIYGSPHIEHSDLPLSRKLQETHLVQNNSLQGDFKDIDQDIQRQFVLLINRIAYQAQIDNMFSSIIFKYSNINTSKGNLKQIIKQKIKLNYTQTKQKFHQNIFDFHQMQIDPLAPVQKIKEQYSDSQLHKLVIQVKNQFNKICNYFDKKLLNQFKKDTINFFIQELYKCQTLKQTDQLNIGHLTSYINMRTGKNLRNRFFYKILNRIKAYNNSNSKVVSSSIIRKQDLLQVLVHQRY